MCIGCEYKSLFFQVALLGLKLGAIDGTCLVYGGWLARNFCARPEGWFYGRLSILNFGTTSIH